MTAKQGDQTAGNIVIPTVVPLYKLKLVHENWQETVPSMQQS